VEAEFGRAVAEKLKKWMKSSDTDMIHLADSIISLIDDFPDLFPHWSEEDAD
jgi:hypothetical protein